MIESLKKEWQAKAAIVLLIILTVWWFINTYTSYTPKERFFGDFGSIYGVMALLGAIWGFMIAGKWGGMNSVMGKSIICFSLGLIAQEFGQIVYAYFSFYQHIEVPYPSLGDLGYFGSIPLYIFGVLYLAKASGVKIALSSLGNKFMAVVIPLIILGIGYFLFLKGYELDFSDPIKVILDFGYPLGQAIYISLAILTYQLSKGILGGVMKNKVLFILFALCVQFIADYMFLYQVSRELWSVGGINDYVYLLSYFVMTIGLIQLLTVFNKLRHQE